MYPGDLADPGLHIEFRPGATLVLGANGLGKTTMIRMMFRMLTGPDDISGIDGGDKLGFRRLSTSGLSKASRTAFATRVSAVGNAEATLKFSLGPRTFTVTRRLADLSLKSLHLDDGPIGHDDEKYYQKTICESAELASFADFVLVLRYLVFYFEDRRQLVWDPSAQIQICRILFLDADMSEKWSRKERDLMTMDSDLRNKRAVMSRTRKEYHRLLKKQSPGRPDMRAELATLQAAQKGDLARSVQTSDLLDIADRDRQTLRLDLMKVDDERESTFRELEHAQFQAIRTKFPTQDETAHYLMAHLIAEDHCLTCDRDVPAAAVSLRERIRTHQCVVCSTPLPDAPKAVAEISDERIRKLAAQTERLEFRANELTRQLSMMQENYKAHYAEHASILSTIASRTVEIDLISAQLPVAEGEFAQVKSYYDVAEAEMKNLAIETLELWIDFRDFADTCRGSIVEKAESVKEVFESHLENFLAENAKLTWETVPFQVGQYIRDKIDFVSFVLDMSGSDFEDATRRSQPGDVSESQKEFIDLSFRMALMSAASQFGTSLVIDTPESSLDGIFAERAADTLVGFANVGDRTLIIASNYVDGELLPSLLEGMKSMEGGLAGRLVDLLRIAKPTAAVRRERVKYEALRDEFLGQADAA